MPGKIATGWIDDHANYLTEVSDKIWDYAEVGLSEFESAELLINELEKHGFEIEKSICEMPTAFRATWGCSSPRIGLLAEYDALSGSSQKRGFIKKEPLTEGGAGHSCGHNLLGTAHLGAALAVQNEMITKNLQGTIVLFGCPAEELLVGKVFMARDGVFNDIDIFLSWHPDTKNYVTEEIWQAMINAKFNFYGKSSHAAASPEQGRSALDAVELMNVGVNYLREHVVENARIHYSITRGGDQPNTVPEFAQSWYFVRGPNREVTTDIFERVLKIAQGAALMTDTRYEVEYITATPENLPNDILCGLLYENMMKIPEISWNEVEVDFAKEIIKTLDPLNYKEQLSGIRVEHEEENYLFGRVLPLTHHHPHLSVGSTDVSNVTWIAPTGHFYTACSPIGTSHHSWQFASSCGMSIGHKGLIFAAKTLALTCMALVDSPELIKAAKEEFLMQTGGKPFESMMPKEASATCHK